MSRYSLFLLKVSLLLMAFLFHPPFLFLLFACGFHLRQHWRLATCATFVCRVTGQMSQLILTLFLLLHSAFLLLRLVLFLPGLCAECDGIQSLVVESRGLT